MPSCGTCRHGTAPGLEASHRHYPFFQHRALLLPSDQPFKFRKTQFSSAGSPIYLCTCSEIDLPPINGCCRRTKTKLSTFWPFPLRPLDRATSLQPGTIAFV